MLRRACGTEQVVSVPWPVNNGSAEGIVAFVAGLDAIDQDRILASCGDLLPDYMVPSKIYQIDGMPLNPNQKIDRRQLSSLLEGARK